MYKYSLVYARHSFSGRKKSCWLVTQEHIQMYLHLKMIVKPNHSKCKLSPMYRIIPLSVWWVCLFRFFVTVFCCFFKVTDILKNNALKNTDNGSHYYNLNTHSPLLSTFSMILAISPVVFLSNHMLLRLLLHAIHWQYTVSACLLIYFKLFTSESFWFCEMVETAFLRPTSVLAVSA